MVKVKVHEARDVDSDPISIHFSYKELKSAMLCRLIISLCLTIWSTIRDGIDIG